LTNFNYIKTIATLKWIKETNMPASYCYLAVHIIFTTKNHKRWLTKTLQPVIHAYISQIINNIGGSTIAVNGIEDHIHILCLMPKNLSIGEFMAKIKSNSSKWIRKEHCPEFCWQDGYAIYSVSKSKLDNVSAYIRNQDEHHHHTSAVKEYEALLKKHWDPDKLCRP
jgi:REP element-mobilizing transposase RayT